MRIFLVKEKTSSQSERKNILYLCTVFSVGEGKMANELEERVMIERVELIARLTTEGVCKERDREIALNLIAEMAANSALSDSKFSIAFPSITLDQ